MALLTSEIQRIKYELGYNTLTINAEPYIGIVRIFENVVQEYMQGGATTTSSTSVTASTSGAFATLTLASATGFTAGDRVVVDVDDVQEFATVKSLSGSTISVFLRKAHAGTYPVTVEGGETMVREILSTLRSLGGPKGSLASAAESAGIKRVDEIEFAGGAYGNTQFKEILRQQRYWRNELASLLGVPNLRGMQGSGIAL